MVFQRFCCLVLCRCQGHTNLYNTFGRSKSQHVGLRSKGLTMPTLQNMYLHFHLATNTPPQPKGATTVWFILAVPSRPLRVFSFIYIVGGFSYNPSVKRLFPGDQFGRPGAVCFFLDQETYFGWAIGATVLSRNSNRKPGLHSSGNRV